MSREEKEFIRRLKKMRKHVEALKPLATNTPKDDKELVELERIEGSLDFIQKRRQGSLAG